MSVVTNIRTSLSPRAAAGAQLRVVRPAPRPVYPGRPVHVDGRRPARLVTAPNRPVARPCEPRQGAGSIGWLVLAGVLVFLVVLGIGWGMGAGSDSAVPTDTVTVTVHPGQTLWSVAHQMAPGVSTAAEIARIRQLNGLDADSVLYPGELLAVPSSH